MSNVKLCCIQMLRSTFLRNLSIFPHYSVKAAESEIFPISDNGQNIIFVHEGKTKVMYCTSVFITSVHLNLFLPIAIMNLTAISFSTDLFIPNRKICSHMQQQLTGLASVWVSFLPQLVSIVLQGSSLVPNWPYLQVCRSAIWLLPLHWSNTIKLQKVHSNDRFFLLLGNSVYFKQGEQ